MVCNYRLGAKLTDKGCDSLLGRWSWMKFRGRQGTKVLIITAYQVSQTLAQGLGMDTVYMQHWRKLAKANATVYPRAQFWADLTMFIQTATAAHTEVLVMMDVNADTTDSGFATFLIACGETYYRGKKKIGFCLGTNRVAHAVTHAGITSYKGGLKYSDHRALFVDINEELLFTSKGVDPTVQKVANPESVVSTFVSIITSTSVWAAVAICINMVKSAQNCALGLTVAFALINFRQCCI